MKRINLEQRSPSWHSWRKGIIAASEAASVLGISPYQSPYRLWQRKLGLIKEEETNYAMERGIALEQDAIDLFVSEYNINMESACVESDTYNFLGASLDGISECGKYLLEVKCNGKKNHEMAKNGRIPDHYIAQIQHQLLVTGAEKCFYYSYDGESGVCIEVFPNADFVMNYLPKVRGFWKCIVFFEAPPLTQNDFKDMGDSLSWNDYAEQYKMIDAQIKASESKKDYLRKKLIEICGDGNCSGAGIKVMKMITSGRVQYDDIPELQSVDLDKYRKESTTSWKILIDQK